VRGGGKGEGRVGGGEREDPLDFPLPWKNFLAMPRSTTLQLLLLLVVVVIFVNIYTFLSRVTRGYVRSGSHSQGK